jgi:hypothetical protein
MVTMISNGANKAPKKASFVSLVFVISSALCLLLLASHFHVHGTACGPGVSVDRDAEIQNVLAIRRKLDELKELSLSITKEMKEEIVNVASEEKKLIIKEEERGKDGGSGRYNYALPSPATSAEFFQRLAILKKRSHDQAVEISNFIYDIPIPFHYVPAVAQQPQKAGSDGSSKV